MECLSSFQEEGLNVIRSGIRADADAHVVHVIPVVHDWVGVPYAWLRYLAIAVGNDWMIEWMLCGYDAYDSVVWPPCFVDKWSLSRVSPGKLAHEG